MYKLRGRLLRQVNEAHGTHYEALVASKLYENLVEAELLVRHEEVDLGLAAGPGAVRVLAPEPMPFISYPYEWCFGQLKDAATATLAACRMALDHGLVLKDASAYNVQFVNGRARLIDTLSFEVLREGSPWVAYGQFCRHFLAPLALASFIDPRLILLMREYLDGVPLDLAARLLHRRAMWNVELRTHLIWHAKATTRTQSGPQHASGHFSKNALYGLLDSLERCVSRLSLQSGRTTWSDYYDDTNYSDEAMSGKAVLVDRMLRSIQPAAKLVYDIGANTGRFSAIPCELDATTIAWDADHAAVEAHWRSVRGPGHRGCLPLVLDLTNPSPALGWAHAERDSMLDRGPADVALALALIHHLAIGNNVPLPMVARFFARCCRWLIIEFVPKHDSQVQRMLSSREDVFPSYTDAGFVDAFSRFFDTQQCEAVPGTSRRLFLMRRRDP